MNDVLTTSVSLPVEVAETWRENRREIMRYAARYLRTQMRKPTRRGVTRSYNRGKGDFVRVTTRFTGAEYDTLHFVAASLRVSVSSLVYGLVLLWLKPSRRALSRFFVTNCLCEEGKWDPEAGFVEEFVTFWRLDSAISPYPPPWQAHDLALAS